MKKYNINVNGTIYAVEVEEVLETAETVVQTPAPAPVPTAKVVAPVPTPVTKAAEPAPVPTPDPAPASSQKSAPSEGAQTISSPMPGTILDVKVSAGQAVNAGDILLILEAMKMENEILAPSAGTIDTVQVSKGDSVNSGDILVTIK